MRRAAIICFLLMLCGGMAVGQHRVWVDTDMASGKLHGDMDDALALIMLLRDTSVQIEGISVVHGVGYAEKTVKRLLAWYAPQSEIRVYRGARSHNELGVRNEAVAAIEKAAEQGGPLTIMALGPLTNLATLFQSRPELRANVKAVSFCGGRRPDMVFSPGGKARFSDYNFDLDTAAGRMLMAHGLPLTLAGYDCSDSLFLNTADYVHLKGSRHPGDRWMYRKLRRWEGFWRTFVGTDKGFIPFDCATIGVLLYPQLFLIEDPIPVLVTWSANDTQNTIKGPMKHHLTVNQGVDGPSVNYCHHALPAFKQQLLKALQSQQP